jgi:hypothetical protein
MSKIGINVGEDFPAEEVAQSERGPDDHVCGDREEWRARSRAFKEDVRGAARRHFGDLSFTSHNGFMLRALFGLVLLVLALALLPHVLLLAILVIGIALFMLKRGHFHHHHYETPRNDAGV